MHGRINIKFMYYLESGPFVMDGQLGERYSKNGSNQKYVLHIDWKQTT